MVVASSGSNQIAKEPILLVLPALYGLFAPSPRERPRRSGRDTL
jgi:hypothetical protein